MNLSEKLYDKKNNIFQSKEWADFQKAAGKEVVEIAGTFFYRSNLIKGKDYLFAPKGGGNENQELRIKNQVGDKVVFVRVEPSSVILTKEGSLDSSIPRNDNFSGLKTVTRKSLLSQQYSPKQTLVMDLTKSEEDLLSKMKSKHRYNIRLAEKKGVTVKSGSSKEDVENFYNLSQEVSKRDKTFSSHPKSYYEKMAEALGPKGNLQIFTAFYDNEPISSILILFYNETAIYLHGASANKYRELMPNHLVQWTAIKEAKKRGCKYYDFWGTSLIKNQKDKEQKVWDFKIYGEDVFEAVANGFKKYETRAGNKKGVGKELSAIKPGDILVFSLADPNTDKVIENVPKIEKNVISTEHFDTIDILLQKVDLGDLSVWKDKEKYKAWWKESPELNERIVKYGIWAFKLSEPETDWTVDELHPWAGITKFKMGFVSLGETGQVVEFPGALDLILKPFSYKILCLGKRLRKIFT